MKESMICNSNFESSLTKGLGFRGVAVLRSKNVSFSARVWCYKQIICRWWATYKTGTACMNALLQCAKMFSVVDTNKSSLRSMFGMSYMLLFVTWTWWLLLEVMELFYKLAIIWTAHARCWVSTLIPLRPLRFVFEASALQFIYVHCTNYDDGYICSSDNLANVDTHTCQGNKVWNKVTKCKTRLQEFLSFLFLWAISGVSDSYG